MSGAILPEEYRQLSRWGKECSASDVVDARSVEEVIAANRSGIEAGDIYFTAAQKSAEDIRRVIGRCRMIADNLDELRRINHAAQSVSKTGFLEPVGIRLTLADGDKQGVEPHDLPALSRELRHLPAISVRGCFVQGRVADLHGEELGPYFRSCYEAAKQMSAVLPCVIAFLCISGGGEAARQAAQKHPETLPALRRAADIVMAQNRSSFYARLLTT